MEFEVRDHFTEHDDNRTNGFTIINKTEDRVQIAECFEFGTGSRWSRYWQPTERLIERVEEGACEKVGQVTPEQLRKIKRKVDLHLEPQRRASGD